MKPNRLRLMKFKLFILVLSTYSTTLPLAKSMASTVKLHTVSVFYTLFIYNFITLFNIHTCNFQSHFPQSLPSYFLLSPFIAHKTDCAHLTSSTWMHFVHCIFFHEQYCAAVLFHVQYYVNGLLYNNYYGVLV